MKTINLKFRSNVFYFMSSLIIWSLIFPCTVPLKQLDLVPCNRYYSSISDSSQESYDMCTFNQFVALAKGKAGLELFNISNPTSPKLLGRWKDDLTSLNDVRAVSYAEPYLYVANGVLGLSILNITDIHDPQEIGQFYDVGFANDVNIYEQYAYLAEHGNCFEVIDISDPANPFKATQFTSIPSVDSVLIDENGSTAYVASWGTLYVLNISDILNIGILDEYDYISPITSLELNDNKDILYIVTGNHFIRFIDITNLTTIREDRYYGRADIDYIADIKLYDQYLIILDRYTRVHSIDNPKIDLHLHIIDLSEEQPKLISSVAYNNIIPVKFEIIGNLLCISTESNGLKIYDISKVIDPQKLETTSENLWIWQLIAILFPIFGLIFLIVVNLPKIQR